MSDPTEGMMFTLEEMTAALRAFGGIFGQAILEFCDPDFGELTPQKAREALRANLSDLSDPTEKVAGVVILQGVDAVLDLADLDDGEIVH